MGNKRKKALPEHPNGPLEHDAPAAPAETDRQAARALENRHPPPGGSLQQSKLSSLSLLNAVLTHTRQPELRLSRSKPD